MYTYISMIRGINVGGKRIKMADLKDLYQNMGFGSVKTYIQSGNVIFKSDNADQEYLTESIQQKILETFNYHVEIVIRTNDEIKEVIKSSPFKDREDKYLHVTFLSDNPQEKLVQELFQNSGEIINGYEEFKINSREIYLYLPYGYGRTKLNNNFFEKKLHLNATTRNWKTVNKLLNIN